MDYVQLVLLVLLFLSPFVLLSLWSGRVVARRANKAVGIVAGLCIFLVTLATALGAGGYALLDLVSKWQSRGMPLTAVDLINIVGV